MNKPWNIQIELVRGCNMRCDFCGVRNLPREHQFMSMDTLSKVVWGIMRFDPMRVEFAMRGEPTLHPELLTGTSMIRSMMPQSQITLTTNGILLSRKMAVNFLTNGGNIIVVDCYNNTYDKYQERFKGLPVTDFYASTFNPWHMHKIKTQMICLMRDMATDTGKKMQRVILNQAGNVDFESVAKYGVYPTEKPLRKKCVHPFRELAVWWNGGISLCCRDWGEEMVLYNVHDDELYKEWYNNKVLEAARHLLYNKYRNFGICKRCDFTGGFRQGFLPREYECGMLHKFKKEVSDYEKEHSRSRK